MGHADDEQDHTGVVDERRAEHLAGTLAALADPDRIRVLTALREGPGKLGDLAASLDTAESQLAPQLDELVGLGLVGRRGTGADAAFALHDDHVESLLAEAIGHVEHRRTGRDDRVDREL